MQRSEADWVKYAKSGDRVICIDDSPGEYDVGDPDYWLRLWQIYTIRNITLKVAEPAISIREFPEWQCDADGKDYEPFLKASRFRPLDESRLDQFRAMLKTRPAAAPNEAGAPAPLTVDA